MENYQEYKEQVFACSSLITPEPIKEFTKTGKEKKAKKIEDCYKKDSDGIAIPGYFSYENVKCLFVLPAPTVKEIENGIAWTDHDAKHVLSWIKEAGFYGNNSLGFTYLCHCAMSGFANTKKAFKYCSQHLDNELTISNNPAVMIVGYEVAKVILPKVLIGEDDFSYMYKTVGRDINLFGRQYFFLPSTDYIYTARDEIRSAGEHLLAIDSIRRMANMLGIPFQNI